METMIGNIRKQVDELCIQIEKRIKELGDIDIMTYRSDPLIRELRSKICELYRKAISICKTYGEALKVCEAFRENPVCLAQLMLSEELTCPTSAEETKEK